jgi:hypothetical protein
MPNNLTGLKKQWHNLDFYLNWTIKYFKLKDDFTMLCVKDYRCLKQTAIVELEKNTSKRNLWPQGRSKIKAKGLEASRGHFCNSSPSPGLSLVPSPYLTLLCCSIATSLVLA